MRSCDCRCRNFRFGARNARPAVKNGRLSDRYREQARTLGLRFYSGLVATEDPCGSDGAAIRLARDGFVSGDEYFVGVHIRCCGNGHLGFRPYGGSLGKTECRPTPSNQGLLPLTFGASPRLGMPSLRSCSVGPPPSAIHGRRRLTRHPCRVAHCAEPPLGLTRGQEDQKLKPKQKQKRGGLPAGLIAGFVRL